jgi:hypothetical protein
MLDEDPRTLGPSQHGASRLWRSNCKVRERSMKGDCVPSKFLSVFHCFRFLLNSGRTLVRFPVATVIDK